MEATEKSYVYLRGQSQPVGVTNREDTDGVVRGKNKSGKRFVTVAENLIDPDAVGGTEQVPIPEDAVGHPFRVYTDIDGDPLRVVHPTFDEVEAWFTGEIADPDTIALILEHGVQRKVARENVRSILSCMPGDTGCDEDGETADVEAEVE